MTLTTDRTPRFSQRALRTTEPPISWLMRKTLEEKGMISLAAGLVDQQSLPADLVRQLFQRVFVTDENAKRSLQYGSTAGLQDLRQVLAERLEGQDIAAPVRPEHIVLTSGSQQLLFLITDVLVDAGDIVIVEDPTYFVYMGLLQSAGARTVGVATDDDGIVPAALEERLAEIRQAGELHRLKMLYLMTYYQNPKGTSHSWKRREEIYEIIERYSTPENFIYILEDAAYVDLRFEGEHIPYMKKLDPKNERVMLALTFSKGFAPGFRLGFGHLPAEIVAPVLNQKGNHDFGSGNLSMFLTQQAITTGFYDEHAARLQQRYREKRDVTLKVIREEFPAGVEVIVPKGGLYVWATLPGGISTGPEGRFFRECLDRKVLYVPGCYCYAQEEGRPKPDNQMRLCYAYIEENEIVEGLKRMASAIKACL